MTRVSRLYYAIAGYFLLDTMQAFGFLSRMLYGNWEGKTGDKITQTLNVLMIASALALFAIGRRQGGKGDRVGTRLDLVAVGFLFLSALWSMSPSTTFRVAMIYVYVILGVIGIARSLDPDRFMNLLSWCCFLSAIASIILRIIAPNTALTIGAYGEGFDGADFIGIFPHKNILGQVMATGALATLHGIRVARRGYFGKILMLLVFVGMAYASKSTGALLITLVFCGISGFDSLWRKGGAARMIAVILAVVISPLPVLMVVAPDTLLIMIGKDPTLTGRTEIWSYVIADIWKKPLLGWGYFAFWQQTNPAAVEISDAVHWVVPQAHNGLFEFLLNIGIVGTSIFAFILLRIFMLGIKCLGTSERALAVSTISCCVGIVQVGVSETVLLAPTESLTPILFITGLMCERALWVMRTQRRRLADPRRSRRREIRSDPSRPVAAAFRIPAAPH